MAITAPITKLSAARRQINTAIWLWFHEADPVSIHTLTGAAAGILHDLYQRKYKTRPVPFSAECVKAFGSERKGRRAFRAAEQFFKHARKDPTDSYKLNPEWTEAYLWTTVCTYRELRRRNSHDFLMDTFSLYFGIGQPDLFPALGGLSRSRKQSRVEFFEELFRGIGPSKLESVRIRGKVHP